MERLHSEAILSNMHVSQRVIQGITQEFWCLNHHLSESSLYQALLTRWSSLKFFISCVYSSWIIQFYKRFRLHRETQAYDSPHPDWAIHCSQVPHHCTIWNIQLLIKKLFEAKHSSTVTKRKKQNTHKWFKGSTKTVRSQVLKFNLSMLTLLLKEMALKSRDVVRLQR